MTYYTVPMLIDIFRLTKESLPHTVLSVVDYLKKSGGSFNYNKAARYQRAAYDGYPDLEALHKQCLGKGDNPECIQNAKVLNLISGLAKGRKIQTFDFPKRKLTLAKDIESSMGPSFFFVENEIVNLFYLHCRSEFRASLQDLAMLAAACKLEILDLEFYGLPSDIEFIDVGPRDKLGAATVNKISLADIKLPSADEVKSKTDLFLEAFRLIDQNHLAGERVKPSRKPKEDPQPSLDL